MGKKSTSRTKPVYEQDIRNANTTLTNAYNRTAPAIQQGADAFAGLIPTYQRRAMEGDPTINAAQAYAQQVLGGDYLSSGNPFLNDMADITNRNVRNNVQASLGSRGLTNGSDYVNLIARATAENETGLRYNDYNQERNRMGQAAAMSPSLAAGQNIPLQGLIAAANGVAAPLTAAQGYAGSVGGLLGQYTTTKQKQGGLGNVLGGIAGLGLSALGGGVFGNPASLFGGSNLSQVSNDLINNNRAIF